MPNNPLVAKVHLLRINHRKEFWYFSKRRLDGKNNSRKKTNHVAIAHEYDFLDRKPHNNYFLRIVHKGCRLHR